MNWKVTKTYTHAQTYPTIYRSNRKSMNEKCAKEVECAKHYIYLVEEPNTVHTYSWLDIWLMFSDLLLSFVSGILSGMDNSISSYFIQVDKYLRISVDF